MRSHCYSPGMPRVTDVERQRRHIAEAVWRLAGRAGLEAVSLREVAAEAGVSMGRVQHYFATKDDMLLFGLQLAQRRLEERVERRLRRLPAQTTPEGVLRELLDELLGEHPDTRQMLLVGAAFSLRTRVDPIVAAVLTSGDTEVLELATTAIEQAQAAARTSRSFRPPLEAQILLTLATSLGVEVALGQRTIGDARTVLTYALDRTFGQIR
jgi:TetR/AcrR family transcriptional regulator, transcriptional repressor of bet genes